MRGLIITMVLLTMTVGSPAIAQTGGGTSTAVKNQPQSREAPVGHRQPRADRVPSEKNLSDPNSQSNKEDAALDKKIKSICRGC